MTAPTVGGSAVPLTTSQGYYTFNRQPIRNAGSGKPYGAGMQSVEWNFVLMGSTEWAWWWTQYNRGTAMAFELWKDDTRNTAITFSSGWLQRPEHGGVEANYYKDVKITITSLMPTQT